MLSNDDILTIVSQELDLAEEGTETSDYEEALDYYLGNPDGREVEGRSSVTSTDVADSIEWIMPQIMDSFTQTNEIVIFDPVHEGDERQAELESEFVYEVLMKENDGFVLIHQFVKDALMQKNGIFKIYYSEQEKKHVVERTGIGANELQVLASDPNVEILEMSEEVIIDAQTGMQLDMIDVKLQYTERSGRIIVDSVPPEEFRVNAHHNSINLNSARFTAHVLTKTVSELIEEGYDPEIIRNLPTSDDDDSEFRFTKQGEIPYYYDSATLDESQRNIEVAECYLRMDVNGDGIAELVKVTVAGGDSPTTVLSVEEIECMPWVATTAILMSHKFRGLSIFDRLKEIQDQKTALWRNMLDNMYLQNNQRNIVLEGQVNLDDLLVSRPGGIIRAKTRDAVQPLVTPQIGQDAYNMMKYLDEVRAGRTGVSADGPAAPQNIGDRVGSQGVDRLMTAKEELVGLIVRVIAETGIKPTCVKIRDLACRHYDAVRDFKFRGQWVKTSPTQWADRYKCTVRVGTGTGDHQSQLLAIREVLALQEKIITNPQQGLLGQQHIFNALDDLCKLAGLNGATRYFIDPTSAEGQQKAKQTAESAQQAQQQEQQMQQLMAQSQMELAKAETSKAQAQMANVQLKAQNDMAKNELQLMRQQYEARVKSLEAQLQQAEFIASNAKSDAELKYKYEELESKTALELTKLEIEAARDLNADYKNNKEMSDEEDSMTKETEYADQ